MRKVILIAGLLFITTPLFAGSIKGGYPACISKELFDEIENALIRKDEKTVNYLEQNGCFYLKSGLAYSLISESWGIAQIRVYVGGTSVILWTNIENLK